MAAAFDKKNVHTYVDTSKVVRIKETIEVVSFFLASELASQLFLEKLEYISNIDLLTGVLNRNCMNAQVEELVIRLEMNPRPYSVAAFDINGLKLINDNMGHPQGDRLLSDAANVLKEIFTDDRIYRAGGDEFVIISFDSKELFENKIAVLREKASNPDWLYFAVGTCYDENSGNLRHTMQIADEKMYRDKNKFYEKYPEKKR